MSYLGNASEKIYAQTAVANPTPPVFGGITGLTANSNGSLTASWTAATSSSPPIGYQVYIQAATATGLFSTTPVDIVTGTSAVIFTDSFQSVLTSGTTYYVGVRAKQAYGVSETNTVSTSAVSQGVPATSTNNLLNTIIATIGTPANSTVSADIAQVESNVVSLGNGLDILFEVTAIEIPSTGTKDIPILIRFAKKALSTAVDPDSQIVTVTITNAAGSTVLAATNMTRLNTGVYRYDLSITNSFTPQMLIVAFSFTYLTVPFVRSQVIEALPLIEDLNSIISTLGTPVTASISTDIAAIETKLGTPAGASVSADIAQIETHASSVDTKIGTPVNGTVTADIAQVEGHAASADTKIGTPTTASVSTDIAALQTTENTINSKIGTPATTVSGDIAFIDATLGAPATGSVSSDIAQVEGHASSADSKIGTPVNGTVTADIAQVETHALSTDTKIGTPVNGTVTADIAAVQSTENTINSKIGTPVTTVSGDIAQVETHAASVDTKIGTPVNGTTTADIAAVQSTSNTINSKIGSPATGSVSSDIAQVEGQTSGIAAIPTNPLLTTDSRLNYLDINVSSRATQVSVNLIPTTPQLASVALSQYNALVAAVGSIQNNTNFSGIVPQQLLIPSTGSENYTFYAGVFNSEGSPADPDSQLLNFSVYDNLGNVLQAQQAMVRTGVGQYTGVFPVASTANSTDVVVFFNYSVNSVAFTQIRTSIITSEGSDSAILASIQAKTNLLPADPASNTVVNTRASQTSVNAIPTNPLLTTDTRLNNLDTNVGSRLSTAGFTSTMGTPVNGSVSADIAQVEGHAASVDTKIGTPTTSSVSTDIAALQTTENTINTKIGTPVNGSVTADIALVESHALSADSKIGSPVNGTVTADIAAVQASENALNTKIGTPANASVSADIAQIESHAASADSKIGTPATGSVSSDIAHIESQTVNIANLATQASVNSVQDSIDNLGNNSSFDGIVPNPINLPDSGSTAVLIYARIFDSSGAPADPDSNLVDLTIKDTAGDVIVPETAMTRTGVGQYQYSYTVNSTDPLRTLDIFFDYSVASVAVEQIRTTLIAAPIDQQTNQLTTLLNRLTQQRADNLDNLDVAVSSRAAASVLGTPVSSSIASDIANVQTGVDALEIATDPAEIADAVWNELLSGHTIPGSAGAVLTSAAEDASPTEIAAAVWNAVRSSFTEPGSFGESNGFIIDTKMSVAINPVADVLTMMVWLEQNENIVASPTAAQVYVYDSNANLLFSLGPNTTPSSVGVFTLTRSSASLTLLQNATYVALIQITQGTASYTSLRPFTVF